MKEAGLVSVIMPMYNCVDYVAASIESVQGQTYQNWELLIVDDFSDDGSVKIVEGYMWNDPRIRLLRNAKNSGAALSRNYGLREAQGKWIAFLDSDDLWESEKLEKQIEFMLENDYHFSYTQYREMDEDGTATGVVWTGPRKVTKARMLMYNFIGCLTVMYDAEGVGLVQIPNLKKINDYAMWLKVIEYSPCYLLEEPLARYRVRLSGSVTSRNAGVFSRIKHHYDVFRVSEEMNAFVAAFWTFMHLVCGVMKKIVYRRLDCAKL